MQSYAPRPSEASKKEQLAKRIHSFYDQYPAFEKLPPSCEERAAIEYELSEYIGQLSTAFFNFSLFYYFLIFLNVFRHPSKLRAIRVCDN